MGEPQLPDLDELVRQSRREALRPFLFCTVPGILLVIVGGVAGLIWFSRIGWVLMLSALVWSGAREVRSRRALKQSWAEYQAWRSRQ